MFAVVNLNSDVMAMYETRSKGSEVLLFLKNQGLLSRLRVPERGDAVEERLTRSFQQICRGQRKPSETRFPTNNENNKEKNNEKQNSGRENNG